MTIEPRLVGTGPVVMVDDSESDAFLARKCYDRSGLPNEFVWLPDAAGFLALIDEVRTGAAAMPAFVLLDINMPGTDGFEALSCIRAQPEFRDIPIIMMLTNSSDPRDAEKSMQLGANGFFTKPANIDEYISFFATLAS